MEVFEQIRSYFYLLNGFHRVKESDGTAGIDGVSIEMFEENLEKEIGKLSQELKSGKYSPLPYITFEVRKYKKETSSKAKHLYPFIEKEKRILTIPSVRDRVAQAAALCVIEPILEAEFEKESFAYRKGYSREGAARQINHLYKIGYKWLLDADIRKFFDSVNHSILLRRFSEIIDDGKVVSLVEKWLKAEYQFKDRRVRLNKGLPQGAVISPILANLYLDKFDELIKREGLKLIRFADDFVILTKTKPEAEEALKITHRLLADLKLEINAEKSSITSFNKGFQYLGYLFYNSAIVPVNSKDTSMPIENLSIQEAIPLSEFIESTKEPLEIKQKAQIINENIGNSLKDKLIDALNKKGIDFSIFMEEIRQNDNQNLKILQPTDVETEAADENIENGQSSNRAKEIPSDKYVMSLKKTLYISLQGSELKKEGDRLLVEKEKKIFIDIPALRVFQIIVFGSCHITPAAMQYCIIRGITITLLSSHGKYYGKIECSDNRNVSLERIQYFNTINSEFCLNIARKVIFAKITNCKVLLQRADKRSPDSEVSTAISSIKKTLLEVKNAKTLEQLRGLEGYSSSIYFSVFGRLFSKKSGYYTESFVRSKRPPKDIINSLLSFGYTLLHQNIYSTLRAYSLNPYVGFFHTLKSGHPALVSDLIEEFRYIIDSLVIQILNKGIVSRKDFFFLKEPGLPCLLTNTGRKEFIRQFEIKMHRITTYKPSGKRADYRRCIMFQVEQYSKLLKAEKDIYEPFLTEF